MLTELRNFTAKLLEFCVTLQAINCNNQRLHQHLAMSFHDFLIPNCATTQISFAKSCSIHKMN